MATPDEIRDGLRELDFALQAAWKLGQHMIAGWTASGNVVSICAAPVWRVLAEAPKVPRVLSGSRRMGQQTFGEVSKTLQARPIRVELPFTVGDNKGDVDPQVVDQVVRRYGVSRTEHRAVMLFDIVGFSKVDPLAQMAQLASLEFSINNAAKKMAEVGLDIELARSTVGDGFYVWNRARGFEADLRTYAALVLILADNAVARLRGQADFVPTLRTCFSIGAHYAYHQIEGTRPRGFEYLVGEVTIQLARLIGKAQANQVCVGCFVRPTEPPVVRQLDTVLFLARAEKLVDKLQGLTVGGHAIARIRSQITGGKVGDTALPLVVHRIVDKHGYNHDLFNTRLLVQREEADPIVVGLQPQDLAGFEAEALPYKLPEIT
jgi:class 3 adenylate cyclase